MNIMSVWPGIRLSGFASMKMGGNSEATYINHGLSMLSAILKREGHTCYSNDLRSFQSWEHFEDIVKTQNFDLTLIGFHSVDKDNALQVCRIIKNHFPDKPIIAGGPHVTIAQERELSNVDCIVWGEGETTILELIKDLKNLPKLVTGKPVDDLDSLPFVDREWVNCEFEKNSPLLPLLPIPFYTVNIGRGCPYKCRFCHQSGDNPIFTKKWRLRSVDNFLEELQMIMAGTGQKIGSLMIHDDVFPHRKWCEEFIGKMGWRIPFWCQMRADFICNNEDIIPGLTDLGFTWCSLGVESGSQRMLDFLNKKTTVEQNKKAIEILHRNNVNIFANFFFGGPTETREDIELSGNLIRESKFSWHSFSTYTCYPGSDLFQFCIDNDLFLDEYYSMMRYPYERKIRGVDYGYLFNRLKEFGQHKGELRQYIPRTKPSIEKSVKRLESDSKSLRKDTTVSIILTSHNRPNFLAEAINSVFRQTISDWELIVVDDCSTDSRVLEVLRDAKKDSRVKIFKTNYDVDNIAVLWNLALDKVQGRYIAFLDDDNQKKATFCEEMSAFLDKHLEFDAVACFNEIMKGDRLTGDIFDAPKHINKHNILERNYIDSGCMMVRRSVVDRIGWMDERLRTHEDWDYVIRIMLQTKGFGIIEKPLAIFRWHDENRQYRAEGLGLKKDVKFIRHEKSYSDRFKVLLFHQDISKITLSQDNVLRGIHSALSSLSWIHCDARSVDMLDKIESGYDLILVFMPFSIDIAHIAGVKSKGQKMVTYQCEDPQALYVNLERAKFMDYVFTNDISVQSEYERIIGKGNCGVCPSVSLNDIDLTFRDNIPKKYEVIFYGYAYDSRIKFVKELASKCRDGILTVVGGRWQGNGIKAPCLGELSEQQSMSLMEESKIVVLLNRLNTDLGGNQFATKPESIVRGYFECGSGSVVMLDDGRKHHNGLDNAVVFYSGVDDLIEKINFYLLNAKQREEIGRRAKDKALKNFTYRRRVASLINGIRSMRYYHEVR